MVSRSTAGSGRVEPWARTVLPDVGVSGSPADGALSI